MPVVRERPVVVIPALYSAAGAAWVVLSDAVAQALLPAATDFARWSTLKGLAFVLCTGLLIYALLSRWRSAPGTRCAPAGAPVLSPGAEELRALAAHAQAACERERARIARDLHDHLGQLLTALQLDVDWLERRHRELADGQAPGLVERTAAISAHVREATASVQRIATELRPAVLDRLGLGPALRRALHDFGLRTGIACEARIPDEVPALADDAEIALYRIAQEALTNVARHAGARWTRVTLGSDAGALILSIEDDGCGIRPGEERPQALGVLGMKERAAAHGGDVRLGRGERGGVAVVARVPLARAPAATCRGEERTA